MTRPPSEKVVLIVTNADYDLHSAVVVEELRKRGERVVCWDPGRMLKCGCTYRASNKTLYTVKSDEGTFATDSVKSVWFRRPSPISCDGIDPDYRSVVGEEWKYFLAGLWDNLTTFGVNWVSHPNAIRRAEEKTLQLQFARECGLQTPETIVTNDHAEFGEFFEKFNGRIVAKKLRSHNLVTDTRAALFVTKLIRNKNDVRQDELQLCPIIFQPYFEKQFDSRVIIIGRKVFGFRIHTQVSEATRIDYRAGLDAAKDLVHEYYDLPTYIADACLAMCSRLDLNFGAIDFVINQDGSHVFLELNANGQWLWLQIATRVPLHSYIADVLQ